MNQTIALPEMHCLSVGAFGVIGRVNSVCSLWTFLICQLFVQWRGSKLWSACFQMITESKVTLTKSEITLLSEIQGFQLCRPHLTMAEEGGCVCEVREWHPDFIDESPGTIDLEEMNLFWLWFPHLSNEGDR